MRSIRPISAQQYKYTITFDTNTTGATCNLTNKEGTVGISIGTLPTASKQYYTFKGWFTAKAGGTQITSSYVQNTDNPITVYAQWTPGTYTMTFNANGGTCSTTSKTGTVDAAISTLPTPTRELYTFKGWFTTATGGSEITTSYVQSTTSNITVYAHWEALPYTMQFDGNGNAAFPATVPSPSTRTYYADTAVGTLPTPTRSYHTFDGWYTAVTGGTKITTTYAHPSTNKITVYAHWTPYTFKLTLNPGGGTCSETVRTCSVGVAIGSLPTPTRDYYTFNGWYDAASGGNKIDSTKTYSTNSAAAIYAQWTEKPWSSWYEQGTVSIPTGATTETKTQYQYRDKVFTDWSAWGAWGTSRETISDSLLTEEQTATIYPWYYFKCPYCGYHNKLHKTNCTSSSCKKYFSGGWNGPIWTTRKWTVSARNDSSKVSYTETEYGYGLLWSYSTSQATGVTDSATGYRYRTRTFTWGSWTSWSDSSATASSTREVNTRTMIRYKEK